MGIKYKGTVEIPNLSDENDMDDLDVSERFSTPVKHYVYESTNACNVCFYFIDQICVTACKDQPITPLTDLMRKEGAKKIRMALGNYVKHLKTRERSTILLRIISACKLIIVLSLVTCYYRIFSGYDFTNIR